MALNEIYDTPLLQYFKDLGKDKIAYNSPDTSNHFSNIQLLFSLVGGDFYEEIALTEPEIN